MYGNETKFVKMKDRNEIDEPMDKISVNFMNEMIKDGKGDINFL